MIDQARACLFGHALSEFSRRKLRHMAESAQLDAWERYRGPVALETGEAYDHVFVDLDGTNIPCVAIDYRLVKAPTEG